jgi:dishevelled associated activator of morphogenesis
VALQRGLEASLKVISVNQAQDASLIEKNINATVVSSLNSSTVMASFLLLASQALDELKRKIDEVYLHYYNVLAYFGEDASMSSQDFFATLNTFVQEFIVARDSLERANKVEKSKAMRDQEQKNRQLQREKEREKNGNGMISTVVFSDSTSDSAINNVTSGSNISKNASNTKGWISPKRQSAKRTG